MAQEAASSGGLIRTKLLAPVQRDVIPRPEALAALSAHPGRRLVLLRAPAGWGKSSLLQAWHAAEAEDRDFAWFALDASDNDPVRFFSYLIEAMRRLSPGVGARSLEILRAPGASLVDDVLPSLLAELEALPGLRCWSSTTTTSSIQPRCTRRWECCSSISHQTLRSRSPPGRSPLCRWPGSGAGSTDRDHDTRASVHCRRGGNAPQRRPGSGT